MADPSRLAAALLLVTQLLSGCAPTPAERPYDDGEGPIIFADGPDTSYQRQFAELVTEWNADRGSDEQVTFVELPGATDEHRAQDLAGQDPDDYPGQCYDVITMDVIWTAEFAQCRYLVPLDAEDFDADRFVRKPP